MSFQALTFLAGPAALRRIQREGLQPEMVQVVTAAAGGPKWMVLSGLDKYLFPHWFANRQEPLWLIGSSSGAWRMACAAMQDTASALDRFQESYANQTYLKPPTPADLSESSWQIVEALLGENGIDQILNHPVFRLHILAVRSKGLTGFEQKIPLLLGLAGAIVANFIHRRGLTLFFERTVFHNAPSSPLLNLSDLPGQTVPLTSENLRPALRGSGAIPWIMSGISDIPGAPPGLYRDGGVIDYHLDLPIPGDGLVLFPHYTDRLIPGWLDKKLTWRKPKYIDNLLLVAPSRAFLDTLPHKKIPDRDDFYRFVNRDAERIGYWNTVAKASQQLGDEFAEVVSSGQIGERVRPMFG